MLSQLYRKDKIKKKDKEKLFKRTKAHKIKKSKINKSSKLLGSGNNRIYSKKNLLINSSSKDKHTQKIS